MGTIIQTVACIKRNNRFILLFLGFAIIIWMEVLCSEKTVIPQLLSNPFYDGLTKEEIIDQLHDKRFISSLVALFLSLLMMAYAAFTLYLGNFYTDSAERKGFIQWFKVAFYSESFYLVYRLYMVVVKFLELDLEKWDIKERFSLASILDTSDWGIFANMLNMPLASVNVITVAYCMAMVFLISVFFKIRFVKSLKYVLCTYVLASVVITCLVSFILFVNV